MEKWQALKESCFFFSGPWSNRSTLVSAGRSLPSLLSENARLALKSKGLQATDDRGRYGAKRQAGTVVELVRRPPVQVAAPESTEAGDIHPPVLTEERDWIQTR